MKCSVKHSATFTLSLLCTQISFLKHPKNQKGNISHQFYEQVE